MNNIFSLAFLFVLIGMAVYVVMIFNGLIAVKNDVAKAWANIDILLKQRHDELPNLVEVCKGYMNHERETLEKSYPGAQPVSAGSFGRSEGAGRPRDDLALRSLFAVAENYPQLKANENFLKLQNRITELESEIADRREFYNDSVNTFNVRIQQVPDTFIAAFMSLRPQSMFKVDDADKAEVKLSFGAAG